MKILVISDTHRQVNKVITVLHNTPDITNVIHLGDYVRDADEIQEVFPDKVYHKIQGNNDMLSFAKPDMLLSLCGYNIFATHGHHFNLSSLPPLPGSSFFCPGNVSGRTFLCDNRNSLLLSGW